MGKKSCFEVTHFVPCKREAFPIPYADVDFCKPSIRLEDNRLHVNPLQRPYVRLENI